MPHWTDNFFAEGYDLFVVDTHLSLGKLVRRWNEIAQRMSGDAVVDPDTAWVAAGADVQAMSYWNTFVSGAAIRNSSLPTGSIVSWAPPRKFPREINPSNVAGTPPVSTLARDASTGTVFRWNGSSWVPAPNPLGDLPEMRTSTGSCAVGDYIGPWLLDYVRLYHVIDDTRWVGANPLVNGRASAGNQYGSGYAANFANIVDGLITDGSAGTAAGVAASPAGTAAPYRSGGPPAVQPGLVYAGFKTTEIVAEDSPASGDKWSEVELYLSRVRVRFGPTKHGFNWRLYARANWPGEPGETPYPLGPAMDAWVVVSEGTKGGGEELDETFPDVSWPPSLPSGTVTDDGSESGTKITEGYWRWPVTQFWLAARPVPVP